MKPRVREVIVVEGRYDKNTLSQVVDATIVETGGFRVFDDAQRIAFFRRLAKERGLIVFTDSDGAGFMIRNHLKGALPREQVKHAYIPDVYGKERRKRKAGKEGKLGVEGMGREVLLDALRAAGATFEGEDTPSSRGGIKSGDLLDKGFIGAGSSARRSALLKKLSLPEHLSSKALLEVLNILMTKEEFDKLS